MQVRLLVAAHMVYNLLSCLQVTLYVSFYVEAVNRDAFMAVKQDLLLAFIDCVDRNGAKLAKQRLEARLQSLYAYRSTA